MEANEAKKPKRPRIGQIQGAADNAPGQDKHYEKSSFTNADHAATGASDNAERPAYGDRSGGYQQRPYQQRNNYNQGGYNNRQGGYNRQGGNNSNRPAGQGAPRPAAAPKEGGAQ